MVTLQLKDIQLTQLNNECLKLVAKFSRALKALEGVSLRMQDADILVQISEHAHRTKSKELKALYAGLKVELQKSVHKSMKDSSD